MVRRGIPIIVMTTLALALVSAAQVDAGPEGGPMRFGPEPPFGPAPPPVIREYAQVLRARAREAQELADRLRREADGLDRLAMDKFGPGKGPQGMDPGQGEMMGIKGQIDRLRNEASRAKAEGRFDESQRLWDEAQSIEMKLMREQEVRGMAENLGAMKQKAAMLRQQSMQAKQDGRQDEAKELWDKADQIERDMQGGLEKIERFKMDSGIKDRRMMAEGAKKPGDNRKAKVFDKEPQQPKERIKIAPKKAPQDGDLTQMVEELRGEVKQLRRELEEMKARSGEPKAK